MRLVRFDNPPVPSSIAATNTTPSGPPVICTLRVKPGVSGTGVVHDTPSSEWVTKIRCPLAKSFQEMYMRPANGLVVVLSTHIDSRSSSEPLCAHAPRFRYPEASQGGAFAPKPRLRSGDRSDGCRVVRLDTSQFRMTVAEPEPGRVLTESDTESSMVTTTTVSARGSGSLVQISSVWDGAGGIGGLFERMFAPRVMRAIYADEFKRLDAYAREHRPA